MRTTLTESAVPARKGCMDIHVLDDVSPEFILAILSLNFGASSELKVSGFPHVEQWWDLKIDAYALSLNYDEAWGITLFCDDTAAHGLMQEIQAVLSRTSRWSPLRFFGSLAHFILIPFRIPRIRK